MRYALLNPRWSFEGSTYLGCGDPHFPLGLLAARETLRASGHDVLLIDAHMESLGAAEARERLNRFGEDFLVIPTAPSHLFWRCPQPELRVPMRWISALDRRSLVIAVGPHGSATPRTALEKTRADVVLRGEPDQTLPMLSTARWETIPGCCWRDAYGVLHLGQGLGVTDLQAGGAIEYSEYPVHLHTHKHRVFPGNGGDRLRLGAEVEFARGCHHSCTVGDKKLLHGQFRERSIEAVLKEIDGLISRGVDYIYFIDEIFGVGTKVRLLLEELALRPVAIGLQTRIDLWNEGGIELLARAHCISFECGIESVTEESRSESICRLSRERIGELLIYARQRIPWVQANFIKSSLDDGRAIADWRHRLRSRGVSVSEPAPEFPFPGSPQFVETFGEQPGDDAWERAHSFYLDLFDRRADSDLQKQHPLPLGQLEAEEQPCAS